MTSEIYLIDHYANNLKSKIHDSNIFIKMLFVLVLLSAIIFSKSNLKLLLYISTVICLMFIANLPVKKLLKWSIYPLIFSLVFAISQAFYSFELAATTVLRASSSILMMIFFITTTGFNNIFQYAPSKTIRNSLFLTYRFFFMTVDSFNSKLKLISLRGGNKARINRKIQILSQMIGLGLLESIEKAERVYKIMHVRGFQDKISISKTKGLSANDLILYSAIALIGVIWII